MGVRLSRCWKSLVASAAAVLGLGSLASCNLDETIFGPVAYGMPPTEIPDYPDMYGMPPASSHHTLYGTVTNNGEAVENISVKLEINGKTIEEVKTNEYGSYVIHYFEEAEDGLPVKLIFDNRIIKVATLEDDEYDIHTDVELTAEDSNA